MNALRAHWRFGLLLAALALLGLWVINNTEWTQVEVERPLGPLAANDSNYALKKLARELGTTVIDAKSLERMPPAGATLYLASPHWDMFPERERALKRFVEDGGHLVVPYSQLRGGKSLTWVPVKLDTTDKPDADDDARSKPVKKPKTIAPKVKRRSKDETPCEPLREVGASTSWPPETMQFCSMGNALAVRGPARASWSLVNADNDAVLVRVPIGRGWVTVMGVWDWIFDNTTLINPDHTPLATAVFSLRPGGEFWIVPIEARTPLLEIVWNDARPALLLFAAAIALGLWRGAVRFGPLIGTVAPARRSMREQISGTAAFIASRGDTALHQASLRALEQAARQRIAGYAQVPLRGDRAGLIAHATGMPAAELSRAMDLAPRRRIADHHQAMAVLEQARRSLLGTSFSSKTSRP